ncbi:four-carbon acid sugar kinase family protein [Arthrobacter sp. TB 26]|uniref:four-carbon acid sugar kinase family protein n=1 Tax=Arthrobacter sp. TB 26 TaxID=494420 RepID=UPI00041A49FF|nr:four-carbon acid sugar kinase family protein [Arthrobacter sp. TB 26]
MPFESELFEADVLAAFPAEVPIPARTVADALASSSQPSPRILVVLDDDPTGTQSVADLPVLTRWDVADFTWAFTHLINGRRQDAVYVLTNTRSLDPAEAAARNEEVVRNALTAAALETDGAGSSGADSSGVSSRLRLAFVSRSDSTLRGHYPLEPDTIAATIAAVSGEVTDGVVIVPAFPDAGRVTVGGVHYMRGTGEDAGKLTPVAETEFARDASFGFANSELAKYVEEKSKGRFPADSVIVLSLDVIRAAGPDGDPQISADAIADAIDAATGSTPIVADIVTENDFRALALGLEEAERRGKKLLYRVGPPFVRGRIGQEIRTELSGEEAYAGNTPSVAGGLIVVGSHVGVTTRQLKALVEQHSAAHIVEIDVEKLLGGDSAVYLDGIVRDVVESLHSADVILHTSRLLIKTDDAAESLRIARTVSAAVVAVVNRTLKTFPPRFVIAKGGITSSDVAAHGLEIRHAIVRGPMLPGIVSLWEPVDGPAKGIPYVVFAGNVGDDESLAQVTRKLSNTF